MKHLAFSVLLFLCLALGLQAQTYTLTVAGTITESGTGQPVPNHAVDIIIDSTLVGFYYTDSAFTNASGQYALSVSIPGNVSQGLLTVGTGDCTPSGYFVQNYLFSPNQSSFSNADFQICVTPSGSCNASFSSSNVIGTNTQNFSDNSSGNGSAITSWTWSFGDGSNSSLQNPSHSYASAGSYLVCLSIGTAAGCTNTFCDSVFVNGNVPSCTASIQDSITPNGSVLFFGNGIGTGSVVSMTFDFGDGNSTTTTSGFVSHSYAAPGTYNACVLVNFSDSCQATACTSVSIGTTPPCQSGFFSFPDTSGQYSIIIVNTSTGNNLSYSWDFGDGNGSTQAYPMHTYSGPGTYLVCLTVASQNPSCSSTFCDTLVVLNKVSTPFSLNVIPNTATSNQAASPGAEASFFPNPAKDFFLVDLNLAFSESVELEILDLGGRVLQSLDFGDLQVGRHQLRVETSAMPAGLYLVRLRANDTHISRKLMITK